MRAAIARDDEAHGARIFLDERLPKFLNWLEHILQRNRDLLCLLAATYVVRYLRER